LPFGDGNAASLWHPAFREVNEFTARHKFGRVESRGSGIKARGLNPPVNAIEEQIITLVLPSGARHDIGKVLPEGVHIKEIKSTAELVNEIKGLITAFFQRVSQIA
jgi:hypothetical protein